MERLSDLKERLSEFSFYKENESDMVWWVDTPDLVGEFLFSFDKQTIYNMFQDYPYKLTPEEKEIFDRENPQWKMFFKSRK